MRGERNLVYRTLAGLAALAGGGVAAFAQTPSFTGLSSPFGFGTRVASVAGVTPDGSAVVGGAYIESGSSYSYTSFRWRRDIGFDEPVPALPNSLSEVRGISDDGRTIVGNIESTFDVTAWIVTDGAAVTLLGRTVAGISGDGSTCVGWTPADWSPDNQDHAGVFDTSSGEWTTLVLPPQYSGSRAFNASFDGSVIAGEAPIGLLGVPEAFVSSSGGVQRIVGPGDYFASSTICVDATGTVVFGSDVRREDDPFEGPVLRRVGWRWTAQDGAVEIGTLEIHAVSRDGRVAVGCYVDEEFGTPTSAQVWDAFHGTRPLAEIMAAAGLVPELAGWTLRTVDAVGRAGLEWSLAGTGTDPEGNDAAWVATLPFEALACTADYNLDGFVNGVDFDTFVGAFEAGDVTADLDGDGFVNGVDFDGFTLAFEAGC